MKPISLEMYGFMTYKNKTSIDFTKLYDSKIFLISGDTGSGKTSIFDAISFALFGEIQREGFDKKDIRSDFLSGNDKETYVDLKFEIDRKLYRVKRIPNQIAKKTRHNVSVKHSAQLYEYKDSKEILLADKINDVDRLIKEIIGLDNNQLNRVMILAQGEFSKFLKSSSDDKAELLSKIFRTNIYKDIEELLKEKSRDSKKNLDNISKSLKIEIRKNEFLDDIITDEQIELKDFKIIYDIIDNYSKKAREKLSKIEIEKNKVNINLEDKNKEYSLYKNQNDQIKNLNNLKNDKSKLLIKKEDFLERKEKLYLSQKADMLYPYYKNLCESKKNIKTYDEKKSQNRKKLEYLKISKESLDNEKDEIDKVKSSLGKKRENILKANEILKDFDELKILADEVNKFKKDFEKSKELKSLIEKKDEERNLLKDKINEKSDIIIKLNDKIQELNDKGLKANKINHENKNLYNLSIENDKKIEEFNISKKNIVDLSKDLEKSKSLLKKAKNIRRNKIINTFRKEIDERGVCPVCGSIHYEKITFLDIEDLDFDKINEEYISIRNNIEYEKNRKFSINYDLKESNFYKGRQIELDKNLDKLKDEIKEAREKSKAISDEKEILDKKLNDLNEEIDSYKKELSRFKNFDDIEKLEQKHDIKKEELGIYNNDEILEKSKKEKYLLEQDEKMIKDYEEKLYAIDKEYESLISLDKTYDSFIEENKKRRDLQEGEFKEKLNKHFESKKEFLLVLSKAKEYLSKKDEIEEYFNKLKTIEIKIESLEQYKDKELIDLNIVLDRISLLKSNVKKIDDKIFDLKLRLSKLSNTKDQIESIDRNLNELHKEDAILYKLSKICDGSLSKKKGVEKLNLETFVLTNYFRKILHYANIRLKDMTDGQFIMKRKTESSDKRKNFGLDIEILDANTGKLRSEASLSGGESFIASLCLALGLSDAISQENGGIKIDTLFIDEGFGTLSDDYLDKTIRTIEKLSYNNKFIGLISHVKELKDAIDAKIEVTYSKTDGSSLEVIV
ncbi:AAA family ATPase [Anaerococcus porci]|uniref:AAA family ATPase n=1 Tax=Anaerococcus porci TaxID=2652269 RepID=UPI002A7515F0|nr:AAA family ATPase [Anaerococcus porci]MDY3006422.1 AAA family ATPase [Anaerococcus porci]